MSRPALELADIFQRHGAAYRAKHPLLRAQLRAMRAIEVCRTSALGGHVEKCSRCDHTRISYNSCRNRHCPKCQTGDRAEWVEKRKGEVLPVEYFHVVFTVPEEIAQVAFHNKERVYGILFRAAAETLLTIARDRRHLGAEIGFFAVLHTWGQNLLHHPHVHCVVPGGGLANEGTGWVSCRPGFFLPVRVLSRLFRRLFLEALDLAWQAGELQFFGNLESLRQRPAFLRYLKPVRQAEWVVYAKPPFGGPRQVLEYLGRYTHRTAISNQRLLNMNSGGVTFHWKDYRQPAAAKTMTVTAEEFIRRFLIHILPPGFKRIRHYGFLSSRHRKAKLATCFRLLSVPVCELLPPAEDCRQLLAAITQETVSACPECGIGLMIRYRCVPAYRWPDQPPNTS